MHEAIKDEKNRLLGITKIIVSLIDDVNDRLTVPQQSN